MITIIWHLLPLLLMVIDTEFVRVQTVRFTPETFLSRIQSFRSNW